MKKTVIGIVLIFVSLAGIIGWEMFGRDQIIYDEIVVLNQDVEAYTTITADMLSSRKVYHPSNEVLRVEVAEQLVGTVSTQFIPKDVELVVRYFEPKNSMISASEYVFSLPVESLLAYPRSLSKGDTVYLQYREDAVFSSQVLCLKDANGNDITNVNRETLSAPFETVELKISYNELEEIAALLDDGAKMILTYNTIEK